MMEFSPGVDAPRGRALRLSEGLRLALSQGKGGLGDLPPRVWPARWPA